MIPGLALTYLASITPLPSLFPRLNEPENEWEQAYICCALSPSTKWTLSSLPLDVVGQLVEEQSVSLPVCAVCCHHQIKCDPSGHESKKERETIGVSKISSCSLVLSIHGAEATRNKSKKAFEFTATEDVSIKKKIYLTLSTKMEQSLGSSLKK